jgi:hypothetical protein
MRRKAHVRFLGGIHREVGPYPTCRLHTYGPGSRSARARRAQVEHHGSLAVRPNGLQPSPFPDGGDICLAQADPHPHQAERRLRPASIPM